MRSGQPDPFTADVVHVGEDGGDGADIAGRLGFPCGGVEMLDDELVHLLIDGKYARRGWTGLRLRPGFASGHDSLLPPYHIAQGRPG